MGLTLYQRVCIFQLALLLNSVFMKIKVLIAIFIFNISCQKYLSEEEDKINIIDNKEELDEAITGIYGLFSDVYYVYNNDFLVVCALADDINLDAVPLNYGYCKYRLNIHLDDIIRISKGIYKDFYKTIISANNLIKQESNIQKITQANTYIGEAYFIRSVCYFYLTRIFGNIPIVTDLDVKYNIKPLSISENYQLIQADMLKAIQFLPSSNETARIPDVTPHRGTAKAVLAEIYLNMAGYPLKDIDKYEMAAKYSGEVIDSSEFYGMGLVNDFAQLWDFDYYNNPEKIFGFNFMVDDPDLVPRFIFELNGETRMTYSLNSNIQSIILPEYNFYNNYPNNYRKQISIHKGNYQNEGYCEFMDCSIYYKKQVLNKSNKVNGLYLYRYAHTLLTFAEAKARSGQLDASAYKAVNKIRRRANKLDIDQPSKFDLQEGLNTEQFADSVVRERALEFCAEPEGRWFDILRLEIIEETHNSRYYDEPEVPWYRTKPEENHYMDIPLEDIWLNPNLKSWDN